MFLFRPDAVHLLRPGTAMPFERVNGVDLFYESTGEGVPIVLCHEFAGDMRAFEPQVRFFARRLRVVAWNYRGYPPSGVPEDPGAYSPDGLVSDLLGLLDGLGLDRVHLAGLATGGNLVLNFAIAHPERVRSLIVAGAGAGTVDRAAWLEAAERFADDIARDGSEGIVANVADAPQRVIFRTKDPRGWEEFVDGMRRLSATGAEHVMREVLIARAPVFELAEGIRRLPMPILVMCGDQDAPAAEPSRFIRDTAPHAGLAVLPMCGHTLNSEEPAAFNRIAGEFLAAVDAGRWGTWRA